LINSFIFSIFKSVKFYEDKMVCKIVKTRIFINKPKTTIMKKTFTLFVLLCSLAASAKTWQVGSSKTYKNPSAVSSLAQNGDSVDIDAGTYTADVCYWSASNLTLRGVKGMATLDANNTASGRKAIWIIGGNSVTIQNVEFSHCHDVAAQDQNWAGIRLEGTGLTVKNCYFHDNDNGILCGANAASDVVIQYTEFNHNGWGDGYSHNLYIGNIKSLNFSYNYSHHAHIGHELKSRAATNYILYNRIGNEATGDASREMDLPNGGTAIVIGNMIEQGPNTDNSNIIGYGLEGLTNAAPHELYLVNNTIVNDRSGGNFVQISSSTAKYKAYNNIFAGSGSLLSGTATVIDTMMNWVVPTIANAGLISASTYDYHLLLTSKAINKGISAGTTTNGYSLAAISEYKHPTNKVTRTNVAAIDLGAYEYGNPTGMAAITSAPVEFYVYSDPYTNTVNLFFTNLQENKDVYIYDVTGKLLLRNEGAASSKISFDQSLLAPGIYIAQAKVGNAFMAKKFIVQ
jgi:hypothetical protein